MTALHQRLIGPTVSCSDRFVLDDTWLSLPAIRRVVQYYDKAVSFALRTPLEEQGEYLGAVNSALSFLGRYFASRDATGDWQPDCLLPTSPSPDSWRIFSALRDLRFNPAVPNNNPAGHYRVARLLFDFHGDCARLFKQESVIPDPFLMDPPPVSPSVSEAIQAVAAAFAKSSTPALRTVCRKQFPVLSEAYGSLSGAVLPAIPTLVRASAIAASRLVHDRLIDHRRAHQDRQDMRVLEQLLPRWASSFRKKSVLSLSNTARMYSLHARSAYTDALGLCELTQHPDYPAVLTASFVDSVAPGLSGAFALARSLRRRMGARVDFNIPAHLQHMPPVFLSEVSGFQSVLYRFYSYARVASLSAFRAPDPASVSRQISLAREEVAEFPENSDSDLSQKRYLLHILNQHEFRRHRSYRLSNPVSDFDGNRLPVFTVSPYQS